MFPSPRLKNSIEHKPFRRIQSDNFAALRSEDQPVSPEHDMGSQPALPGPCPHGFRAEGIDRLLAIYRIADP
jgi:hypothetical protein